MDAFYEITGRGSEDNVIQRIAVLSVTEREQLEARGYRVVRRTLDRTLWRWLLSDDDEATS